MTVLVDSNVLLRHFEPGHPHHRAAVDSITRLMESGEAVHITPQNIAEFWNVCTRPASARGGYSLSAGETERRLRIVERLFPVLTENSGAYPLWRNLVVAHGVQGVQVHDARLVALMQAHGIGHILTLNPADFSRYSGVVTATSP